MRPAEAQVRADPGAHDASEFSHGLGREETIKPPNPECPSELLGPVTTTDTKPVLRLFRRLEMVPAEARRAAGKLSAWKVMKERITGLYLGIR